MIEIISNSKCIIMGGVTIPLNALSCNEMEFGARMSYIGKGIFFDLYINDVTIDGVIPSSVDDLISFLQDNCFKVGGGSGSGAVDSVTGNLVKGTTANPTISLTGTPSDILTFDDSGNPEVKPIGIIQLTDVAGFPTFANGVFVGTAMDAGTKTGLLLFIEFSTNTPKSGTFPTYGTGGTLPVAIGVADGDAVNKGQLDAMMKVGETTFTLDGTQTVFNIPHGLGSTPKSFSVSFSDAGNLNFVQSLRTRNGTNITFACADPPLEGSQTVYWQVFK